MIKNDTKRVKKNTKTLLIGISRVMKWNAIDA